MDSGGTVLGPARWRVAAMIGAWVILSGCGSSNRGPIRISLVDQFDAATVENAVAGEIVSPEPLEFRFDGQGTLTASNGPGETFGWRAANGIEELAVRDGLLIGRTGANPLPAISVTLPVTLPRGELVESLEITMRTSAGSEVGVWLLRNTAETPSGVPDFSSEDILGTDFLVTDNELRTYRIANDGGQFALVGTPRVGHIEIVLAGAAEATFAIESVRLITHDERLASIETGTGWNDLGGTGRESIVSRSGERIVFDLSLGERPWLDLAIGTIDRGPVTFNVEIDGARKLTQTISDPDQWQQLRLDLDEFAGRRVSLSLGAQSVKPGRVVYWGSPVVRHSGILPERAETPPALEALVGEIELPTPQAVIVIVADTLRRDHLEAYGYDRATAPALTRLASEGVLFSNDISQAPWTKPSFPSIVSSLYPRTHGVMDYPDLLPLAASTMAESFRSAGYATFHAASHAWGGTPSRLQQGVEVLHDGVSILEEATIFSKSARIYVPRFLAWLEQHDDVPVFALLHFFDPHTPREPYPPYNTMWTTPDSRVEHAEWRRAMIELGGRPDYISAPGIEGGSVEVLRQMGIDPEAYIANEAAWYDGSIRGMDAEIERLLDGLEDLGLAEKTLIAVISDHGEELLDHGAMGHGQDAYAELLNVPLLLWWPGVLPAGVEVEEVVESIDLMPTLLELSGLPPAVNIQGQSLLPLLADPESPSRFGWEHRGAFSEVTLGGMGCGCASALILDGWKLIHNYAPPEVATGGEQPGFELLPEYQLFDFDNDPLDQRDVAAEFPEIVERMADELELRRQYAIRSSIASDDQYLLENLDPEEVRRLRAMGYINL